MNILDRKWQEIGVDFITALPLTKNGNDAIMTVVDRFTKMVHLVPTCTTATAGHVADLFVKNVWRLHGVPRSITSDRDSKFISLFWKNSWKFLERN